MHTYESLNEINAVLFCVNFATSAGIKVIPLKERSNAEKNREIISNMKELEIEPEGKSPKNLRLTGRDGPPGLHSQIRGAPIWLAIVTPVQCINEIVHKWRH